jgi:uncharacterized SAM-binding protein YcdF (DUF218 family)
MKNKLKKYLFFVLILFVGYVIFSGIRIYNYSFNYSEEVSDVGIVLGAGTKNGVVSPIFRERLNHSIYLYKEQKIGKIILTGGYGKNQDRADSELAKEYLLNEGIPNEAILVEKQSRYTIENLKEAKKIMDSLNFKSALIISDPLHMKRSIELAKKLKIECKPSPTKTSMYKSFVSKSKSLIYESFYFTLGEIIGEN